jgi:hypothetical protein
MHFWSIKVLYFLCPEGGVHKNTQLSQSKIVYHLHSQLMIHVRIEFTKLIHITDDINFLLQELTEYARLQELISILNRIRVSVSRFQCLLICMYCNEVSCS